MQTLEDRVAQMSDRGQAFWSMCHNAFGSGPGRAILTQLIEWENPLTSPYSPTPEETHIRIGRREVLSLLWRRSATEFTPETITGQPQFNPHDVTKKSDAKTL
jgi:hypothetical protein